MKGPPLGPGGEDITWPDQVALRGRKASSTRKIKPETSNLFASRQQHIRQLYCWKYFNNAFRFFWKAMGLAYANPPLSLLAKVLTKIAYEGGRVVICTPDWSCSGEHAYWRRMLD